MMQEQPLSVAYQMGIEMGRKFLKGVKESPLKFFCPNGPQEELIKAITQSTESTDVPVILCTFANGVGKSTGVVHLIMNFIFGPQNGWFDHNIFRYFPYPKVIWYCSEPDLLKDRVIPEVLEYLPANSYTAAKEHKAYTAKIVINNGWTIVFKSYEQKAKSYEGMNVGIIINDEPAPEEIWKAQKSRRRMGCIIVNIMTPLYTPPYIYDEIYTDAGDKKAGYYHVEASVYDACMRRGLRGHLDPDIVDHMVSQYDEDEKEARAFGRFMYYSGKIWTWLNRDLHFVKKGRFPIHPRARHFQVVDPHDARPSAAFYAALNPVMKGDKRGRFIIYDEYPLDKSRRFWEFKRGTDIKSELQAYINMENQYGVTEITRIMDRHFGWQTRGKKTMAKQYRENGIELERKDFVYIRSYSAPSGEPEIIYGHKKVTEMFKPLSDGFPGIVILDNCYHTWNGINHYIRRKRTGKLADDKAPADGIIVEKFKDYPDLMRYLVCSDLTYKPPKEKPRTRHKKQYDKVHTPPDQSGRGPLDT